MKNFSLVSGETILRKMDSSELPVVLSNLKRDWPHSIHTYFFLLNFMHWTKQNWCGEFNFYCPDTDSSTDSVMAVAEYKGGFTYINYHCIDQISCKKIHNGIMSTDVLNWNELLIFEAIHERLVPDLQKIILAKGLSVVKNDRCYQVWRPPSQTESFGKDVQPELAIQPLDENQAELVWKNWDLTVSGSEVIVRDSLRLNGGVGLRFRNNDSFVGWCVEQHYGGIGMLFVLPEYRRRGYADALVTAMAKRADEKKINPFALIQEENEQSKKLFEKLHFEKICMVHWIGVKAGNKF